MDNLRKRERATVLASLHLLQAYSRGRPQPGGHAVKDIATGQGEFEALDSDEIDTLYGALEHWHYRAEDVAVTETLTAELVLQEAVDFLTELFEGEEVDGADLGEWFSDWVERARRALSSEERPADIPQPELTAA